MKPEERWGKNGIKYRKQVFYRAIEKYGWDNIHHEILYTNLSEKEAKSKERELIKKYNSNEVGYGYNCTLGGDGTLGVKRTRESIEKTILGNSKRVFQYSTDGEFVKEWKSIKTIEKTLGYVNSSISACCLGKVRQAYGYIWRHEYTETVEPIKIGHGITVYQYSLDGLFIKEWNSILEIENSFGFASSNIGACCRNIQKSAYGYIWSYEKHDAVEPIHEIQYHQYDLKGNYIQSFNSEVEASKSLGYKNLSIIEVCNGERLQAGGYMWSYEKKDKIKPYKKPKRIAPNNKNVYQYTLNGEYICEWKSIDEAAKSIGVKCGSSISDCCNGKRNIAYGYIWSFNKQKTVPKVTPKIRKVKQLTLDGELVKIWDNATKVKQELGYDNTSIGNCCNHKSKTAYGYRWEYAN